MNHPATYIIRQWLLGQNLVVWDEGASTKWKMFLGSMPEEPDDAFAIYDTTPMSDGRLMTGRMINHPGVQIKVRGNEYLVAFRKLEACRLAMQFAKRVTCALDGNSYLIQNISPQGDIIPLGIEHGADSGKSGTRRRWLFTLNLLCTISPAPALSDEEELAQVKAQ